MPFSWHASRTVRVKVLGDSPWILRTAMSRSFIEKNIELVEAGGPAFGVTVQGRQIDERTVDQGELRRAADRPEGELDRGLVAALAGEAVVGMVSPGERQALGPADLAIDAGLGEGRAVRLGAVHAPGTADAHVEHAVVELEARWAHPLLELLGIGPGGEHAIDRRLEQMDQPQGAGLDDDGVHGASPSTCRGGGPRPSRTAARPRPAPWKSCRAGDRRRSGRRGRGHRSSRCDRSYRPRRAGTR